MYLQGTTDIDAIVRWYRGEHRPVLNDDEEVMLYYQQCHPRTLFLKTLPAGATLLDLGAGEGSMHVLRGWPPPDRRDIKLYAFSLKKGEHFDSYDGYELGDWDQRPPDFGGMQFDAIFSAHFVEHIQQPGSLAAWAASRLKPGGRLFTEWPAEASLLAPEHRQLRAQGIDLRLGTFFDDPTHQALPSTEFIHASLREAGLEIEIAGTIRLPVFETALLDLYRRTGNPVALQFAYWSFTGWCQYAIASKSAVELPSPPAGSAAPAVEYTRPKEPPPLDPEVSRRFVASYKASRARFLERVASERLDEELSRCVWYHTIDLGDGLVTPGVFDYRNEWINYGLPQEFGGRTVLDAGPATGFFSFECAKRGARVACFELPSLRALDRFPGQSMEQSLRKIEHMMFPNGSPGEHSEEDLYRLMLELPFQFCRERLGVQVERHYATVYDVSREKLGAPAGFDWVLAGDILAHTLHPLQALTALASVCSGTLVVVERLSGSPWETPVVRYTGGADLNDDEVSWWQPNRACMEQWLYKLGFREVRDYGRQTAVVQENGFAVERTVLHAIR